MGALTHAVHPPYSCPQHIIFFCVRVAILIVCPIYSVKSTVSVCKYRRYAVSGSFVASPHQMVCVLIYNYAPVTRSLKSSPTRHTSHKRILRSLRQEDKEDTADILLLRTTACGSLAKKFSGYSSGVLCICVWVDLLLILISFGLSVTVKTRKFYLTLHQRSDCAVSHLLSCCCVHRLYLKPATNCSQLRTCLLSRTCLFRFLWPTYILKRSFMTIVAVAI